MSDRPLALTRRAFLRRAVAAGIAFPTAAAVLEACTSVTTGRPSLPAVPSGEATWPRGIVPLPRQATYAALARFDRLVCADVPAGRVRDALVEVASAIGIPLLFDATAGASDATLAIVTDAADLPEEGYRLDARAAATGIRIEIHGRDEAGVFAGLQSLRQLLLGGESSSFVQLATVVDHPGFRRRGVILDTPQPPTRADRLDQLSRVEFGVRHKMNLLSLPDANGGHSLPDRSLVEYCDRHFVELLSMVGYKDWLTAAPRPDVLDFFKQQVDLGIRSFSLNWDDIYPDNPDALARHHADVLGDVHAFLVGLDPAIRVSVTLPPYGGVPGVNLSPAHRDGSGERYLALMRDAMPEDVTVFWTGDGGIFSGTVSAAGARAYGEAIGRRLALWDNDALQWAQQGLPVSGLAADLPDVIDAYMGNMVSERAWASDDALFTLVTALDYAWNPAAYDPVAASARAGAQVPSWTGGRPIPTLRPQPVP